MPLIVQGEGYYTYDSGKVLDAETIARVRQVYEPVNKEYCLLSADDGSTGLQIWKFDLNSVAVDDGLTVLKPLNPQYAVAGRWILVSTSSTAGGSGLAGAGSPEGVVIGNPGWTYWDTTNQVLYVKNTGTGTNTGWQNLVGV
jgi:hypothetical protein